MKNTFNLVAPVYDLLAKIIFGEKLRLAQKHFLPLIPKKAEVLILGGGTGNILTDLYATGFHGRVFYVEASSKMTALTQKKLDPKWQVELIHGEEDCVPDRLFDVIITNFVLDLFNPERLEIVVDDLKAKLKPDGFWVITEFKNTGKPNHTFLIKLMLKFFQYASKIESRTLYDYHELFERRSLSRIQFDESMKGLIFSSVYKCPTEP